MPKIKAVIPLTDEQRKLVEDNIALIDGYANTYRIKNKDEIYSTLAIGLCKAAQIYDKNKGSFSTIAYRYMGYEMKHDWYFKTDGLKSIPDERVVSYNVKLQTEGCEEDIMSTFLGEDEIGYEDVITQTIVEQIELRLTEKESKVLRMLLKGRDRNYIAKQCGCSVPSIAQNIWNIRKKSKDILEQIKI